MLSHEPAKRRHANPPRSPSSQRWPRHSTPWCCHGNVVDRASLARSRRHPSGQPKGFCVRADSVAMFSVCRRAVVCQRLRSCESLNSVSPCPANRASTSLTSGRSVCGRELPTRSLGASSQAARRPVARNGAQRLLSAKRSATPDSRLGARQRPHREHPPRCNARRRMPRSLFLRDASPSLKCWETCRDGATNPLDARTRRICRSKRKLSHGTAMRKSALNVRPSKHNRLRSTRGQQSTTTTPGAAHHPWSTLVDHAFVGKPRADRARAYAEHFSDTASTNGASTEHACFEAFGRGEARRNVNASASAIRC